MGKVLKNGEPVPKKVYFGRYQLKKNMITVHIFLHYCTMIFELALLDQSECYFRSGCHGKFNCLQLLSHISRPLEHQLPTNPVNPAEEIQLTQQLQQEQQQGVENHFVSYPVPYENYFYFHRRWDYYG
jgi:hypothetical protein